MKYRGGNLVLLMRTTSYYRLVLQSIKGSTTMYTTSYYRLVLRSIQLIWTIGCLYTSPFLIVVCPSIWHRKGAPIWMISDLCYGSGDTVINYSYVCWGQSNEGFSVIGSVCLCGSGFRGARIKVDVRMRRTGTCIPWFELLSWPTSHSLVYMETIQY
jgi:hypothetical protein